MGVALELPHGMLSWGRQDLRIRRTTNACSFGVGPRPGKEQLLKQTTVHDTQSCVMLYILLLYYHVTPQVWYVRSCRISIVSSLSQDASYHPPRRRCGQSSWFETSTRSANLGACDAEWKNDMNAIWFYTLYKRKDSGMNLGFKKLILC